MRIILQKKIICFFHSENLERKKRARAFKHYAVYYAERERGGGPKNPRVTKVRKKLDER